MLPQCCHLGKRGLCSFLEYSLLSSFMDVIPYPFPPAATHISEEEPATDAGRNNYIPTPTRLLARSHSLRIQPKRANCSSRAFSVLDYLLTCVWQHMLRRPTNRQHIQIRAALERPKIDLTGQQHSLLWSTFGIYCSKYQHMLQALSFAKDEVLFSWVLKTFQPTTSTELWLSLLKDITSCSWWQNPLGLLLGRRTTPSIVPDLHHQKTVARYLAARNGQGKKDFDLFHLVTGSREHWLQWWMVDCNSCLLI